MARLACSNLVFGYGRRPMQGPLSFDIEAGDRLVVLGPNGAGKTTLIKTLLGFVPPVSGTVTRGGDGTAIGYVPQQSDIRRDFPASVREIVQMGCLGRRGWRPWARPDEHETIARAMADVDIAALAHRSFSTLSGGQQRRVLIARALVVSASLLLLDEPTAGLDPDASSALYVTLEALATHGTTIVIVSHDVDQALGFATHVIDLGTNLYVGDITTYRHRLATPKEIVL